MSHLRFAYPWALLLVPVAVAAFVVWRRRLGGAFTFAAVACLALALAGPQWATAMRQVSRLYALDTSGSVFLDSAAALAAIRRSIAELYPSDRAGLLVFAASPAVVVPPTAPTLVPAPLALPPQAPRPDSTDIAAAIRLAAQQLAEPAFDRQVVLLTDGRETAGRAALEAALAADAGLRVFAVPVGPVDFADARVATLRAPPRVRLNEPFGVVVELATTAPLEATLELARDGSPLEPPRRIALQPGITRRFAFTDRLDRPGPRTYAARLLVADRCAENNAAEAVVLAEGKTSVLCLSAAAQPELARVLQGATDFRVERIGPRDLDRLPVLLAGADCLVLDGLPAADFAPAAQAAVRDWVRDAAAGLIAVGGPQSYGPGGYAGTPIEEALPVLCSRPRQIALVVALDRSGSMEEQVNGRPKIAFAREAVVRAAADLTKADRFGLIAFAGEAEVVFPLGPVPSPEALAAKLDRIAPHGPTELRDALERALALVAPASAQVRHVIAVTDGRSSQLDSSAIQGIRREYAKKEVTLSALMTGSDPKAIERLKELTGASFHLVKDPANLPARFLEELRHATYGPFVRTGPATVRPGAGRDITQGVQTRGALGGYIHTVAKATATAEWVTGEPPDPILARWQFGLGRAVAFASTVGTQWDEKLWGAGALSRLWQQAVYWAARPQRTPGFDVETTQHGDEILATLHAEREGRFLNGLSLLGRVARPEGKPLDVAFQQTAPGEYQAAFAAPVQGIYHLTVVEEGRGQRFSVSVASNYAREWEEFGVDRSALEAIVRNGRGELLDGLDGLRAVTPRRAVGFVDAAWLPIAAALILFVAGVAAHVFRSRRMRL